MKIGILTLPLHTNYGGILQVYALQTVLERMGHEVCLIEKKRKPAQLPLRKAPLAYGKRIVMNLMGHPLPIFYEQKINREKPIVQRNIDGFICKYIKRRIINDFPEIKETDFDVIIVGSDQIWRPKYSKYFKDKIERAYLDFSNEWNIKRIAYAASFGTDKWEYTPKQTRRCGELLKHFDAVSVREASAVDLCYAHFGVEAQHVLDPTLLLAKEDYIQLFENANTPKSKGTLLNYILDETPEKTALINKIAKEKNLVPFRVNAKKDINLPVRERIAPSIEQWLRGFYDAEFVVTDSFHACVFSILFNKPFLSMGNADRGMSRFTSLLSTFGLEQRMMTCPTGDISEIKMDWDVINSILKSSIQYSKKFLSMHLNS